MRNKVVLIYGLPACGKLTVARGLALELSAVGQKCMLFDNHFFNDIIFPYVSVTQDRLPKICRYVYKIRDLFLDALAENGDWSGKNSVLVFTNVLMNDPDDIASVKKLEAFAVRIGAEFYAIELTVRREILISRVVGADRREKHKLTDKNQLAEFISTADFMKIDPGMLCSGSRIASIENNALPGTVSQISELIKG